MTESHPDFAELPEKMPALFIGHGSPMNAIEDNEFSRAWAEFGPRTAEPRAILCVSAHWETPARGHGDGAAAYHPRLLRLPARSSTCGIPLPARRSWPPGKGPIANPQVQLDQSWGWTTAPGRCCAACSPTRRSRSCSSV